MRALSCTKRRRSRTCNAPQIDPQRAQYADDKPRCRYGDFGNQLLARLVRHVLNRGNVLEGPLTDRIADAGNPGCQGQVATLLSRSRRILRTAGMGHEERFPPPRLSDRYGFSKETVARVPGTDRDAPIPAVRGRRSNCRVRPFSVTQLRIRNGSSCPTPATARTRSGRFAQMEGRRPFAVKAAVIYSITSSARARIEGGIVSPSAFAVLRLTTSSNLVGCWTGRSAGFAPFRILST
jgi:hypothetical protein